MAVDGITDMCGNVTNTVNSLVKGVMDIVTLPMTVIESVMNTVQGSCQK